ncbi:MAG: tetratricopeptide repeat protein [Sandaracinus sp.]|nr:tetratricopeptide repeat protein [Sandaracinus sp.]
MLLTSGHRFANDFVFDDLAMFVEGDVIHDLGNLPGAWTHRTMFVSAADDGSVDAVDTYRPLTVTTFFVNAAWSGRRPFGYHLTGLLLHLFATLLVVRVAHRSFAGPDAATFAGLVFGVHPWLVEAHVWINGRSDSLALVCTLLAALAWLSEARGRHAFAAVGVLAALLSKETAMLLAPALVILPRGGSYPTRDEKLRRGAILAVCIALYLGIRVSVLSGARVGDAATLGAATKLVPVLVLDALTQALFPRDVALRSLRDEYMLATWQVASAWVAAAGLSVGLWWARRRPLLVASAFWFVGPLVPVAVIATVLWPGFGRYLYLGMPGIAWALASAFERARTRWPRAGLALAASFVVLLGAQTALATLDWRNDDTLYTRAIEAHPDSPMGYGWMGLSLFKRDRPADAIPYLEQAVLRDPQTHRYLARLGQALQAVGRLDDAAVIAERGIGTFAGRPEEASYHMIALRSMTRKEPDVAVRHLLRCLEVWPGRRDCNDAVQTLRRDPEHAEALRRATAR